MAKVTLRAKTSFSVPAPGIEVAVDGRNLLLRVFVQDRLYVIDPKHLPDGVDALFDTDADVIEAATAAPGEKRAVAKPAAKKPAAKKPATEK